MAVILLVFIAALALLSVGGWVWVSRLRSNKEEELRASLNQLLNADEKPVARPTGKRKPLAEPLASDLAARMSASFDLFVSTWGAFARAVAPYEALTRESYVLEYEKLGRMDLPQELDEQAIGVFMEVWRTGYLRRQEIAEAKAAMIPGLEETARAVIKADEVVVEVTGEIKQLDKTFVVSDETYDQSIRALVVITAASKSKQLAKEIVGLVEAARQNEKQMPSIGADAEPEGGWDTLLEAHLEHQEALLKSCAAHISALKAAMETGKELGKNPTSSEPQKPDAAEVNAYIDGVAGTCRQNLCNSRRHDEAMDAFYQSRTASGKAMSDAYSCSGSSPAPQAVQAAAAACSHLRSLVQKRINDWAETEKRLTSKTSTQVKADVQPAGEEKNLIAALTSQTRALAMALGALALAKKKRDELYGTPSAPDLVTVAVTDEASLARTMRLLDEWSRTAVRRESNYERAGVEYSQREAQFNEAKEKLAETVSRAERYARGKTLSDAFLVLLSVAEKIVAMQRAKEPRRDYDRWY